MTIGVIDQRGLGRWMSATGHSRLTHALSDIGRPVATTRRIALFSTSNVAGTSTLAHLVAATLARHRAGRVLLTASTLTSDAIKAYARPSEDELNPLPVEDHDRLTKLGHIWLGTPEVNDRFFDVHIVDGGTLVNNVDIPADVRHAHALCMVAPFDRSRAEPAAALALALAALPQRRSVTVAFTDTDQNRSPWPRLAAHRLAVPAAVIEHDPALPQGRTPRATTARVATVLSAHLLTESLTRDLDDAVLDGIAPAPFGGHR